jgi:dTDP-4-dehydrorhamnose reductase
MARSTFLITGLGGSLAPRLAQAAKHKSCDVLGWNRHEVDPQDLIASQAFLEKTRPDAIFHLANGSVDWCARLAKFAAECAIPFVYTSTAMVFDHHPDGPHQLNDERTAREEYGQYKIACEDAIRAENPAAIVARIGWQIDPTQAGNNMLMALDQWQERDGNVGASRVWRPACSFMQDTAAALITLAQNQATGVFHLDSNAIEGHTFADLVTALKMQFARDHWIIREHEDYRHDQRLVGSNDLMPALSSRLAF